MKKIIYIMGIMFLILIIILNFIYTAKIDNSEHVAIGQNSFLYIVGLILVGTLIYLITKIINKYLYKENIKKNVRIYLFIVVLIIYIIFNIIWLFTINPKVVGDSVHVCNLAQTFYRNNPKEFLSNDTYLGIPLSEYMQAYHQQISLSFVFSIYFRLIKFDIMETLRALNIIANISIIFALYKINKQLSKKYETNNVLLFTLILTFITIPMLSTFIYGDIPSLALCLWSVYFMMKYTETKKYVYPVCATIFTMVAYMMRMNSLIFIIATIIYLVLQLINEQTIKEKLLNILVIFIYIVISIVPTIIVQNYYLNKYNLDNNKTYPNISYILMGMEESPRANGWYNEDIARPAINGVENIKQEYVERVKERLIYFSKNIGYTFNFYTMKIASMWTENTYSTIMNNQLENNNSLEKITNPLTFYQKVLLIVMSVCSLIVLIQNIKNISIELLFLVTIFIGGFAFHILWEAKSRYIIPYIVVLIPIASININKYLKKSNNEIKEKV